LLGTSLLTSLHVFTFVNPDGTDHPGPPQVVDRQMSNVTRCAVSRLRGPRSAPRHCG